MSVFTTTNQLKNAVAEWNDNQTAASDLYGHVSTWNTSLMTSMCFIFADSRSVFNDDVNGWDVSQVTDMSYTFKAAAASFSEFDQELNGWNVAKVKTFSNMFRNAARFNRELSSWNVGNTENFGWMFGVPTSPASCTTPLLYAQPQTAAAARTTHRQPLLRAHSSRGAPAFSLATLLAVAGCRKL